MSIFRSFSIYSFLSLTVIIHPKWFQYKNFAFWPNVYHVLATGIGGNGGNGRGNGARNGGAAGGGIGGGSGGGIGGGTGGAPGGTISTEIPGANGGPKNGDVPGAGYMFDAITDPMCPGKGAM